MGQTRSSGDLTAFPRSDGPYSRVKTGAEAFVTSTESEVRSQKGRHGPPRVRSLLREHSRWDFETSQTHTVHSAPGVPIDFPSTQDSRCPDPGGEVSRIEGTVRPRERSLEVDLTHGTSRCLDLLQLKSPVIDLPNVQESSSSDCHTGDFSLWELRLRVETVKDRHTGVR